jgi:hypothetical protein
VAVAYDCSFPEMTIDLSGLFNDAAIVRPLVQLRELRAQQLPSIGS